MIVTNNYNIPQAIYNAIVYDDYDGPRGNSESIGVTSLINSPRSFYLKKRHYKELKEDASNCIWRLLGHAMHAILERAGSNNNIVEERISKIVDGITISGKMDVMDESEISDYKITSVWQYVHAPKDGKTEHAAQLNVYRWLVSDIFPNIQRLTINMILRDWSAGKAKSSPDFPPIPFVSMNIPIWPTEQVMGYIKTRIDLFKHSSTLSDDNLPECLPEECWERPTVYAVMKDGGKRSTKNCSTMAEAQALIGPKMHVETRIGGRTRCAEYCVVSHLCNQYQSYLAKTGGVVTVEAE